MSDVPSQRARELLRGGYDTHVHVAPDVVERVKLDAKLFSDVIARNASTVKEGPIGHPAYIEGTGIVIALGERRACRQERGAQQPPENQFLHRYLHVLFALTQQR